MILTRKKLFKKIKQAVIYGERVRAVDRKGIVVLTKEPPKILSAREWAGGLPRRMRGIWWR